MASTQRKRGSLFDSVTKQEFPFQWEPKNREKLRNNFGVQNIISRRLPTMHYTGGADNSVNLDIILTGVAHVHVDQPTSSEVGVYRYNEQVQQNKNGQIVQASSVDDAKAKITAQKKTENASVQTQINNFKKFMDPQDDTGAPHPVFINVGGVYTGRRFVMTDLDVDYTVTNYDSMEPTEAKLKLVFREIENSSSVR